MIVRLRAEGKILRDLWCKTWCARVEELFFISLAVYPMQGVLDGKYDDLLEQAFYMVGGIEEVSQKAKKLAKDMA